MSAARISSAEAIEFLAGVPLFAGLASDQLREQAQSAGAAAQLLSPIVNPLGLERVKKLSTTALSQQSPLIHSIRYRAKSR